MTNRSVSCGLAPAAAILAGVVLAAGASGQATASRNQADLHIPAGRSVSFNHYLTDGEGFRWDFNAYGSVNEGTNYCYSSGMMLRAGDNVFRTGSAWSDQDGDEFEIGPAQLAGLTVHRRIRVYTDRPMARWLDIFTNTGAREVTTAVTYVVSCRYGVGSVQTSSGDGRFDAGDSWFITSPQQQGIPSLLHIVCDSDSQLRPDVVIRGGNVTWTYRLTVPAGQSVVLCHFESQNNSQAAHERTIEAFNLRKLLADVSGELRGRIANLRAGAGVGDVYLTRNDRTDTVTLNSGDVIYGTITNEQFVVEAFFDTLTLPAEGIIGMEADPDEHAVFRTVLTDGQVVCGKVVEGEIGVTLSTGGQLAVPLSTVAQWAFRLDDRRPELGHFNGTAVALWTGDLLAIDAKDLELPFRTAHGTVSLSAEDLLELRLEGVGAGQRATLLNGSRLTGLLEPDELTLSLALGKTITVRREKIRLLRLADALKPDASLTTITLANGDTLLGSLTDEQVPFASDFGGGQWAVTDVRSIKASPTHLGRARVLLWDGTTVRGEMTAEHVRFHVEPGPELNVPAAQIVSIVRAQAVPREQLLAEVAELVARLGAESYTDRESASEALKQMSPTIVPLLRDYLDTDDPEVQRRLQEIIDHLGRQVSSAYPGGQSAYGGAPPGWR